MYINARPHNLLIARRPNKGFICVAIFHGITVFLFRIPFGFCEPVSWRIKFIVSMYFVDDIIKHIEYKLPSVD